MLLLCAATNLAGAAPVEPSGPSIAEILRAHRDAPFGSLQPQSRIFIFSLDAAGVAEAHAALLAEAHKPSAEAQMALLIERWGQLDGPAALAFAHTQEGNRIRLESRALFGWAIHDPRAAWEQMLVLSNQAADRRYSLPGLLAHIGEADFFLALTFYQDLAEDRACLECHASNLTLLALERNHIGKVAAVLETMERGPRRNALRDLYWQRLGEYATERALAELPHASGDDALPALVGLCTGWARRDFHAAFQYVLQHVERRRLDVVLLPVIQSWARNGLPEDVSLVVEKLPPDLSERSLLGTIPILASVNPAASLEWSLRLSAGSIRNESLHRIIRIWAKNDGASALRGLQAVPDRETRGVLLWGYLLARLENNTLTTADLQEIDDDYNADWIQRLLERIAVTLANPAARVSPIFDRAAFISFVETRPTLTEEQKQAILRSLPARDGRAP